MDHQCVNVCFPLKSAHAHADGADRTASKLGSGLSLRRFMGASLKVEGFIGGEVVLNPTIAVGTDYNAT